MLPQSSSIGPTHNNQLTPTRTHYNEIQPRTAHYNPLYHQLQLTIQKLTTINYSPLQPNGCTCFVVPFRVTDVICVPILERYGQKYKENQAIVRGGPDDTWRRGGYGFSPCASCFFAPSQKQTFFSSQAKEHANRLPPHITPFFCQFCEQSFLFYWLLNKLFFFYHFLLNNFFSEKKHSPPRIIWSAPYYQRLWRNITTN